MAFEIHKVRVRAALKARREPYWASPIAQGRFIGFRKIDGERGSWIARMRTDNGRQQYNSLGLFSPSFDYDQAKQKAEQWFKSRDLGVTDDYFSVEQACKEYVEDRRAEKGDDCAHDADKRFDRTVYGTSFGGKRLAKLTATDVKQWRLSTGLGKASQNRTMTSLRAALNLAIVNRRVSAGKAIEWKLVKQHAKADKRRKIFLDVKQRRRLMEHAAGGGRDLIEAACYTGARPGDIVRAKVSQFEPRTGSMTYQSKGLERTVPLPKPAIELFARLSEDKKSDDFLFTRDDGKPWGHGDWDEVIREAAEKAKLPEGTCLYVLRHSFITQAITDGIDPLTVARLTGTSLKQINEHYGHLIDKVARKRLTAVEML